MKRTIFALILLVLAFSLVACRANENTNGTEHEGVYENGHPDFAGDAIGDIVQLGGFDWIVIHVEGNRALALSLYLLDALPYHYEEVDITWEHSSIRAHLNGPFLESTFSQQERERIAETLIINHDNPEHGVSGGNDTMDRVFLLSYDEVTAFMGDDAHPAVLSARTAGYPDGVYDDWWWLRSPGFEPDHAMNVFLRDGWVNIWGDDADHYVGIRPAMWINLE